MPNPTVSRTSLKVRNPANAPDDTDRGVLQELAALPADQLPNAIVRWNSDPARFYRPLITQELCLKCHGDPTSFVPALQPLLDKIYPEDQATGDVIGDLRGVIRVDILRP